MIDALVGDGDLVLLEPVTNPGNGDMVAAWLPEKEEAKPELSQVAAGS